MEHGDLSNQCGYTIAFRCEDCLIKYRESTFKDKVLNTILGKVKRAEVNPEYARVMEHLYRHTSYTVDLVIHEDSYTKDLKNMLDDLPFNRIVLIKKDTQISQRLITGDLTLYVDEDTIRRSLINSEYAIPMSRLNDYIKRRT
jgi:hypothetical protein